MLSNWNLELEEMYNKMVEWRRFMHQYPELSNQEYKTSKLIASILSEYGIEKKINVGEWE